MQKKYEAPELEVLKPFIDESICDLGGTSSGEDIVGGNELENA